ncbi:hypothetical protein C5C45_00295 [Rathayibacter rathayi]|uniref:Exonuclease domain-containing protein n=2 Tax=Rathayibacter rathayi TaxID=33887 RepID=A0ABX5AF27_RATRA|nr:exonuclease domain-containing protein [Rathayibacter rathayi]PPF51622.1 hypothetical protein C5C08_02110 [Rathayibacter rathayi]PPF83212.1 hypothetical protein C5C14_02145 [Rathayibacter rathayi]PPG47043.1 hypothetical protein C5C20_02105 [Rathayibacter rathayi]PPH70602.1 hypothetical protein C5C45_00295 [Rathayibacter rathayi]PPH79285.1 hypothetical protein C5C40_02830 [Rathayibacter rathayi]
MSLNFVSLDFETANAKRGSVIQIGVVRVIDGRVLTPFASFVTPPPGLGQFAPRNCAVHGILPEQLIGAPDWPSILERLVRFADGLPIVAHNAQMERSVVEQACEAHGLVPPAFDYFCSLKLARGAYREEKSHSLAILSARIGLPSFKHHNAAADAVAGANLVLNIARGWGVDEVRAMPVDWLMAARLEPDREVVSSSFETDPVSCSHGSHSHPPPPVRDACR